MRGALGSQTFRRLLGAWTIGNLADSALFLTLAVWTKDITGSSSAAGLVFLALGAPVLVAPLIGMLADRVRRRPLLVAANLVGAGSALALLAVETESQLWLVYVVAVTYGSLGQLNSAAQSGLLRDVLPDEQLDWANGLMTTVDQGLRVATPVIGVAIYATAGPDALVLGVATLLTLTAIALAAIRVTESAPEAAQAGASWWTENVAGFRHLREVDVLWQMLLVLAVAFGVIGAFDVLIFELVEHGLERPPEFVGVLLSLQGAGSILGGLTAAVLLARHGPLRTVGVALAVMGTAVSAVTLSLATVPLLGVVAGGMFLAGVSVPWVVVAIISTRIRLTPARLQGRAAAAMNVGMSVPQLTSSAAGAVLVTLVDYRWLAGTASLVLLALAVNLLAVRESVLPGTP